jgi:hypothetical protein
MQRHVQLFRTLTSISPEVAEQLISVWGSADLHVLVRGITSGKDKRLVSYLSADLLRQFSDLDEDHRQQFPALAPPVAAQVSGALALDQDYLMVNKHFPHVGERIAVTWGTLDFQPYISGLLADPRIVHRQGFPEEFRAALVGIRRKHDQLFPTFIRESGDAMSVQSEERAWIAFPGEQNS